MKKIKIIFHISENLYYKYGGVNKFLNILNNNLKSYRHNFIDVEKIKIFNFVKILKKNKENIFHIHGIWNYKLALAALIIILFKNRFVLSVHGNLNNFIWKYKGFLILILRKLYWSLIGYPIFKYAKKIHAVESIEHDNLKKLFKYNDIHEINHLYNFDKRKIKIKQIKKNIIYFGRVVNNKGVHNLIAAFTRTDLKKKFKLFIYGPKADHQYFSKLKKLSNNDKDKIFFCNPLFGSQKTKILQSSWAFVNPSISEVLGYTNFESADNNLPIIISNKCGIYDKLFPKNLIVEPNVNQINKSLSLIMKWSMKQRVMIGQKVNKIFKKKYNKTKLIKKWQKFYEL
jgi:glycosyltransferase involved in cell wall biosynthesis